MTSKETVIRNGKHANLLRATFCRSCQICRTYCQTQGRIRPPQYQPSSCTLLVSHTSHIASLIDHHLSSRQSPDHSFALSPQRLNHTNTPSAKTLSQREIYAFWYPIKHPNLCVARETTPVPLACKPRPSLSCRDIPCRMPSRRELRDLIWISSCTLHLQKCHHVKLQGARGCCTAGSEARPSNPLTAPEG